MKSEFLRSDFLLAAFSVAIVYGLLRLGVPRESASDMLDSVADAAGSIAAVVAQAWVVVRFIQARRGESENPLPSESSSQMFGLPILRDGLPANIDRGNLQWSDGSAFNPETVEE